MKMLGMLLRGALLLVVPLSGCSRSDAGEGMENVVPFQQCREPRPEICYEVFAPVCATLTGQRATYQNDCKACADPKVQGFVPGQCR